MQTCDTLLHAGVLLPQDDDRRVLENAALAIDGGRIVALGYSQDVTAAWQAREILDLSGMLVMPGLVNAHTHAAMTFLRGLADDMPLMDWLQQKIFPVEQGLTPDLVRLGSLLGFAEMLRTGTTSCVDMYIFESAVLEAADKAGLRCLAGEGVFNFPSACCPDADAALACTREMAQRWAGHDRLHVAVMPHSVYTTTAAQLTACRELADELGPPLHIHLAEPRQETALSLEQHGLRPVAHADRLGLLRPGTILAHGVDVDADEIALLARRGVSVVHNPSSNMKLASGVAPVPAMLDAGVRLAPPATTASTCSRRWAAPPCCTRRRAIPRPCPPGRCSTWPPAAVRRPWAVTAAPLPWGVPRTVSRWTFPRPTCSPCSTRPPTPSMRPRAWKWP